MDAERAMEGNLVTQSEQASDFSSRRSYQATRYYFVLFSLYLLLASVYDR